MSRQGDLTPEKFVDRQYRVAIVFIIGFFILLCISLIPYFVAKSLELATFIGTLFGGWVGTIIGFYFGQRPVEQMRESLKEERERTKNLTEYIKARSDEIWKKLEGKV